MSSSGWGAVGVFGHRARRPGHGKVGLALERGPRLKEQPTFSSTNCAYFQRRTAPNVTRASCHLLPNAEGASRPTPNQNNGNQRAGWHPSITGPRFSLSGRVTLRFPAGPLRNRRRLRAAANPGGFLAHRLALVLRPSSSRSMTAPNTNSASPASSGNAAWTIKSLRRQSVSRAARRRDYPLPPLQVIRPSDLRIRRAQARPSPVSRHRVPSSSSRTYHGRPAAPLAATARLRLLHRR